MDVSRRDMAGRKKDVVDDIVGEQPVLYPLYIASATVW